jgi:hypothetical protein
MEWKHDSNVMDLFRAYLVNQKEDLKNLLEAIFQYNDGTPPFQFLQVFGVFVVRFSELIETNTETDALDFSRNCTAPFGSADGFQHGYSTT